MPGTPTFTLRLGEQLEVAAGSVVTFVRYSKGRAMISVSGDVRRLKRDRCYRPPVETGGCAQKSALEPSRSVLGPRSAVP
jgi:hypothetical protein